MNQFNASLWGDEGFAAVLSQKSLIEIVRIVGHDTSPPLYYFSAHFFGQIFGFGEVAIRLHAFLYFLGAVLGVYFIAKHLWEKRTGLLAAILTFLNPFLFRYGFEGRMYSILLCWCVWSIYFFLRLKGDLRQKKYLVGFVLATAAALYSHHFAIFVVMTEFFWLLPKLKQNWWLALRPFLWAGLLYLPWLPSLYYQTSLVAGGFWLGKPKIGDLFNLWKTFSTEAIAENLKNIIFLILGVLLILRKNLEKVKKSLLILSFGILPVLLAFLISQLKSSIFFDRYLLYTVPPLLLILSSQRRKVSYFLLFLLILIWSWGDYRYFTRPSKAPFREFAAQVKQKITPADQLINFNGMAHHLWETKYYGLEAPLYAPSPLPFFVGTALMTETDIINKLPETPRLGVITSEEPKTIELPGYQQGEVLQVDKFRFIWFYRNDNLK